MSVQELNTLTARSHPLWCNLCRRPHGLRDAKHRQTVELYEYQVKIWSTDYRPAPAYPRGPACGDCERVPCTCTRPDDLDLAWLPRLADHDRVSR